MTPKPKAEKSRIVVGTGKFMWQQRSRWPITIGPYFGEDTPSRLRLTGEPTEWYARISENEALICPRGANSGVDRLDKLGKAHLAIEIHQTAQFWPKTADNCEIAD